MHAGSYNTFVSKNNEPAVDQPDMNVTLNSLNRLFIDQLLGNLYASQERVKRT